MLANSTSGYADYVYQPGVTNGIYADPFRQWTTAELIKIGTSAPLTFPSGTNWAYSHTNYAILGTVLAKAGGQPLSQLMRQYIFEPMGLTQTQGSDTRRCPNRYCTPSAPNAARRWESRRARRSTRRPPSGIRHGLLPEAPRRPPASRT
jgi:CubicO group peptidase (beta-lactamase class C family)